jgi:hypothetical protein
LAGYDATDRRAGSETIVHGELFVARNVSAEQIKVTEGTLFIASFDHVAGLDQRLSPSGKAGLRAFLDFGVS